MISLGKLEEITDLRSVWPHEAHDLTESSVGDFNVDIFATDANNGQEL